MHNGFSEVGRFEVPCEIGSRLCGAHLLDEHEEAKRGAAQRDEAERLPELLKEGGEHHPCRPCFSGKASGRLPLADVCPNRIGQSAPMVKRVLSFAARRYYAPGGTANGGNVSHSSIASFWPLADDFRYFPLKRTSRLTANAQRTNPSDLLVTRAASATTRPRWNCQDGGDREIRIGPAVGHAARCGSLTLLVASEPTIARASIVVALKAIPIFASCDRGYASCEDGRKRREGKKEGTHFSLPR